jgi:hypothetical protein
MERRRRAERAALVLVEASGAGEALRGIKGVERVEEVRPPSLIRGRDV